MNLLKKPWSQGKSLGNARYSREILICERACLRTHASLPNRKTAPGSKKVNPNISHGGPDLCNMVTKISFVFR